jgi:hypothetical protein
VSRTPAWLLACALLGGCSLGAPGAQTTPPSSQVAQAETAHEYPSPPPPRETATGDGPAPIAAIESFASQYINWQADTIVAQLRSLAAQSVGQARSAMQLAAAQTEQDYELRRGGVANSGKVEAVALLAGRRDQYVVVTREQTTATATTAYAGLRPAWHVSVATVVQLTPGRWVISRWQPET